LACVVRGVGVTSPLLGLGYIIVQLLAGVVAGFVASIVRDGKTIAYPVPNAAFSSTAVMICELVVSFALASVVLNTATTKKQVNNSYFGLAIGFTVVSGAIAVGGVSGGCFNPAVAMLVVAGSGDIAASVISYFIPTLAAGFLAGIMFRCYARNEYAESEEAEDGLADRIGVFFIEFFGTFYLCFIVTMSVNFGGALTPIAIGSALMCMIFMGGPISGGHFNPAVTLGVFIRLKWSDQPLNLLKAFGYVLCQVCGSVVAGVVGTFVAPTTITIGFPKPSATASIPAVLVAELIVTFALVSAVLNTATTKENEGKSFFGLAIGFTVTSGAVAVGAISGGAFNPAIGTGLPLIANDFAHIWQYWVTGIVAGMLAPAVFLLLNPAERFAVDWSADVDAEKKPKLTVDTNIRSFYSSSDDSTSSDSDY